jgi:hypothetical protein
VSVGDRIKDPRGIRVVVFSARWGYRTEGMVGVKPWPRIGRMKVIAE